jgi:hypothetical protein
MPAAGCAAPAALPRAEGLACSAPDVLVTLPDLGVPSGLTEPCLSATAACLIADVRARYRRATLSLSAPFEFPGRVT